VALLHDPLSSGTTIVKDECSRETTLWVLRRTLSVRKLEDRFLWVVHCSRIIRRDHLLLGAHFDFGHITPLEPLAHVSENAVTCIDMENRVVLAGDITEDALYARRDVTQLMDLDSDRHVPGSWPVYH